MSFETRLKVGSIGERLVDAFIRQQGYVPYYPDTGMRHPFDRLIASPDKRRLCVVEVKTKPRREAYDDTGIDECHFNDYEHITTTYAIPLFLAFVDAKVGAIYGNRWHELLKPRDRREYLTLPNGEQVCVGGACYPWHCRGIVYFPRDAMRTLHVLTEGERKELLALRTSAWRS
ncbi:MAG TPA: hypothetical protein VE200_10485 [Xanthobacteraceae bacterium]|nr:hypothetical protein [Xanthobacteraceae bacterium]